MKNKVLNAAFILLSVPPPIPGTKKTEYAMVRLLIRLVGGNTLQVITRNETLETFPSKGDKYPALFESIEKLNREGWEVYSSNESNEQQGSFITYFLKRKVKQ